MLSIIIAVIVSVGIIVGLNVHLSHRIRDGKVPPEFLEDASMLHDEEITIIDQEKPE